MGLAIKQQYQGEKNMPPFILVISLTCNWIWSRSSPKCRLCNLWQVFYWYLYAQVSAGRFVELSTFQNGLGRPG